MFPSAPPAVPAAVTRVDNVFGQMANGLRPDGERTREEPSIGSAEQRADTLTSLVVDTGMDNLFFASSDDDLEQTRRFAQEVAPAVRCRVTGRRR